MKGGASRTVGPDEPIRVRADSTWDVPEPELALVLNRRLELLGFTAGNDVSSRSIEGPVRERRWASCPSGICAPPGDATSTRSRSGKLWRKSRA